MPEQPDQTGNDRLRGTIEDFRRHIEPIDEDHALGQARERRDARRRRRRALQSAGAVGSALVIIVAVVVGLSSRQSTTEVAVGQRKTDSTLTGSTTVPIPEDAQPGWAEIPKAPIEARRNAMSVWTGREVLVFGGASKAAPIQVICPYQPYGSALPCGKDLPPPELPRAAAAYDPTTNSWRRIAPLPAGFTVVRFASPDRFRVSAMLDGKLYVLAWKRPNPDLRRHLLCYDPKTDTWTSLGRIEPKTMYGWALTTYDHSLIAYPEHAGPKRGIARRYDPDSGTWSDLHLPLRRKGNGAVVYASALQMYGTDSGLYLFSTVSVTNRKPKEPTKAAASGGQDSHYVDQVASFDGHTWKQFTVPESYPAQQSIWIQDGDTFTTGSGLPMDPNTKDEWANVVFDPSDNSFHLRPVEPIDFPPGRPLSPPNVPDNPIMTSTVTSSAEVFSTVLAVLDPSRDHWNTFVGPSDTVLDGFSTTWAGSQIFFWGGYELGHSGTTSAISDRGWIWTPPGPGTTTTTDPASTSTTAAPSTTTTPATSAGQTRTTGPAGSTSMPATAPSDTSAPPSSTPEPPDSSNVTGSSPSS